MPPHRAQHGDPHPRGAAVPALRVLAVLPARIGSTRLPRKVLLAETGLPLFVHTARRVAQCAAVARVLVATDDEEVRAAGRAADVDVVLTSAAHPSGTDRVHEAVGLAGERYDVVLNVQADEPEVDPGDLARLASVFADPAVDAATLAVALEDPAAFAAANVVKVVCDLAGDALYFSRAPIPARGHGAATGDELPHARRHLGVYAYRPEALAAFCALPRGRLEELESLEQLRWLEHGRRMRVVPAWRAPHGIDTRADYEAFVRRWAQDTAPAPGSTPPRRAERTEPSR